LSDKGVPGAVIMWPISYLFSPCLKFHARSGIYFSFSFTSGNSSCSKITISPSEDVKLPETFLPDKADYLFKGIFRCIVFEKDICHDQYRQLFCPGYEIIDSD
jgi:hypothetical protein